MGWSVFHPGGERPQAVISLCPLPCMPTLTTSTDRSQLEPTSTTLATARTLDEVENAVERLMFASPPSALTRHHSVNLPNHICWLMSTLSPHR